MQTRRLRYRGESPNTP